MNAMEKKFAEISAKLTKEWTIESETGYKPISNCWGIFTYAERNFNVENMKQVCASFFEKFKQTDYKTMTEFVIVMNHKIWQHYESDYELGKLYDEFYHKSAEWCEENFNEEQMQYYFQTTD